MLGTNRVVGETWTFKRRRAGNRMAATFLAALERSPRVALIHAGPEVEGAALRWLRQHDELGSSLVDAVGFEVLRRRRIRDALAFDGSSGRWAMLNCEIRDFPLCRLMSSKH